MATTSNYSWTTPDDTDLVKDGASAIRTLGSAIDTTVFNNAGAAVAKSTVDAKGDLIVGTANDTVGRLAVGTDGYTLVADSVETTGLKWVAPAGGTLNAVSVANGTITSGTSLTISSLSNYDQLFLALTGLTYTTGGAQLRIRVNGSSSSVYFNASIENRLPGTIVGTASQSGANDAWRFGPNYSYDDANNENGLILNLFNCKSSSGFTTGFAVGGWKHTISTDRILYSGNIGFLSNAAISSITIDWEDGNTFSGGTYRLLGA